MRLSLVVTWHALIACADCIEYCPSGQLVIVKGLKPPDEDAVACAHNRVRRSLTAGEVPGQPRARSLKTMAYDQQLAHKATPVSKQCADTPLDVKDRRWPCVAQHVYKTCSGVFNAKENWDEVVDFWFSPHEHFVYPNGKVDGQDVSTYRQLAWAETDTFGCDFYLFISLDDPVQPFCKLYTCNYGFCANSPSNVDLPPYDAA